MKDSLPVPAPTMTDFLLALVSTALINNFVLQWPLGVDPLLQAPADSARLRIHALGLATTVLMLVSCVLGHVLYRGVLVPWGLQSLQLFAWLSLSVLLIRPALHWLPRALPGLPFDGLWPLLLANAGMLGLLLIASGENLGLATLGAMSLGAGLGFWLVLSLFNDLRQRISTNDIPLPWQGLPIDLISAGLLAVAFFGFNGLLKT
ncbi:NADH:quinone oxidoreductase [Pseudomonas protegens]|nr:electron transport complex protein [Pseudomonas protegens]MDT9641084.1 NADH:quinone oxidoreductase [Pseudomonas sp. JV245A]SCZ60985.1 electron transport complex protein RnfA [Pseudomonas sp. NFPP17]SDA55473.1 electron transport complex protein RnfA [Pseudomonas sp. NFPP15]SEK78810.1 electron transport complex protein RnfA [Pseudomonas sp. NFPP18]SFA53852.1 electron transport complex protein RnfA [Pseudomonas sp. NFPP13]SFT63066.1 electron transport complex protein RnfA [Pseudomonas sp. NFP